MITKLFFASIATLGLASLAFALTGPGTPVSAPVSADGDCCSQQLECCAEGAACCDMGQECCADGAACCETGEKLGCCDTEPSAGAEMEPSAGAEDATCCKPETSKK